MESFSSIFVNRTFALGFGAASLLFGTAALHHEQSATLDYDNVQAARALPASPQTIRSLSQTAQYEHDVAGVQEDLAIGCAAAWAVYPLVAAGLMRRRQLDIK